MIVPATSLVKRHLFAFPVGGRGDFLSSILFGNKLNKCFDQNEVWWPVDDSSQMMKIHQWGSCEYSGELITAENLPTLDVDSWIVIAPTFQETFESAYLNWYKKFRVNDTIQVNDLHALVCLTDSFNDQVGSHQHLFDHVINFKDLFDLEHIQNLYRQIRHEELDINSVTRIKYNIDLNQRILKTCPFDHHGWRDFAANTPNDQIFFLMNANEP